MKSMERPRNSSFTCKILRPTSCCSPLLLVVALGTVAILVVLQADVGLDATVHWRADSAEPSLECKE